VPRHRVAAGADLSVMGGRTCVVLGFIPRTHREAGLNNSPFAAVARLARELVERWVLGTSPRMTGKAQPPAVPTQRSRSQPTETEAGSKKRRVREPAVIVAC
jgi:hypothetical protein